MKTICALIFVCFSVFCYQDKTPIDALLEKPFDLQKYKQKKGGSNSGLVKQQAHYFKPDTKGVYFRFFLFYPPGFIYEGTETKKVNVRPGVDFQIVTYKPPGKYRDTFIDPTETFIELTAGYNDRDLPELAFVGLDSVTMKAKLGAPHFRKDSCFIYTKDANVLVLHFAKDRVNWLKYSKTNKPVTETTIPSKLTVNQNKL